MLLEGNIELITYSNDDSFDIVVRCCPYLVSITNCRDAKYIDVSHCESFQYIYRCPIVECMIFSYCQNLRHFPDIPNAKTVAIQSCPIETFPFEHKSLESLECFDCPSLTHLPSNMDNVIYLHISKSKKIRYIPSLPKLRYLNISQVWMNCFHDEYEPHTQRCYPFYKKIVNIQRMRRKIIVLRKYLMLPKVLRPIVISYLYNV